MTETIIIDSEALEETPLFMYCRKVIIWYLFFYRIDKENY